MDDLQFRRSLYADPKCQDKNVLAAKHNDAARKKFAQDIDALETKISAALTINVPNDLCDKLILSQTMASHQQQKRKSRIHLALAASIAFAFGLLINFMQFSSAFKGLDGYALAHVYHEQHAFDNHSENKVTLASLNDKMSTFNGSFSQLAGHLISAGYCRFDGIKSLHLVFQGTKEPINVFIVPERDEVTFIAKFNDGVYQGLAQKFGQQQVIIVGDKSEPLTTWQKNIAENIQWST